MSDDTAAKPAYSYMERIAALEHTCGVLEARCAILEKALHRAFGKPWMQQVMDEVASDLNAKNEKVD